MRGASGDRAAYALAGAVAFALLAGCSSVHTVTPFPTSTTNASSTSSTLVLHDKAFKVLSCAMAPALQVGYRVLVSSTTRPLHRAVIVLYLTPPSAGEPPGFTALSRVVGLPGDHLEGRNGQVYVNGHRRDEPYLKAGTTTDMLDPISLAPGYYFLMGDNRRPARDSRYLGPIARADILGVVDRIEPGKPDPDSDGC